ncbi:MAG: DMT family transporter [Cytophagales bacterium]|nr:DMT family transporter [Cytophagales bacterium]
MKGYIFLSLSIIFWALNFHLGKIMFESVTPNVAAFWRFFFAVLGLLALSWKVIPSKAVIVNRLPGMLLVGFIGVFGFIFCFTQGLNATSEMNGALFVALSPAISLILAAIFQGHKIHVREILGILLAFLGVTYLLTQGDFTVLTTISFSSGDIYFALAAMFFAVQNILIKQFIGDTNGVFFTLATNLCCLLGFTGLLFMEPGFEINYSMEFWVAAICMGVPGTALAYYGWNIGVKQIGPSRAPVFLNIIPGMVAIFAVPFGAELYSYHLISLLIIVIGVLVIQVKKRN